MSTASVQVVMSTLVKEGLLVRTPKRGTFVSRRKRTLTNVGVYVSENIWRAPDAAFRRNVVSILCERLRQRGLEVDIWIDPRTANEQASPWQEFMRAAGEQRFQFAIMPDLTPEASTWIDRVPVPTTALTMLAIPNGVRHEPGADHRLAIADLARQGCKSVGLIAPESSNPNSPISSQREYAKGVQVFCKLAEALNLDVRPEWVEHGPDQGIKEANSEHFGYEAMKRLLAMPNRPQGMYVKHDLVARGAILAIAEASVRVPDELKLVLQRNAEIGLLCPFKASFVEYSINDVVDALIASMDAQLSGEEIKPGQFVFSPKLYPAV